VFVSSLCGYVCLLLQYASFHTPIDLVYCFFRQALKSQRLIVSRRLSRLVAYTHTHTHTHTMTPTLVFTVQMALSGVWVYKIGYLLKIF